jgi:hypothetical protein
MKRKQAGMILDGRRLTTSKEEGKVGCLQVGRIWASWDDDERNKFRFMARPECFGEGCLGDA